ncbi:MarR family transcriptional regulator [Sinorhizobium sp. BG8]|uniref:MarR family winged helix-turn-helix transcriptional regulator n=1 Tax=Sinorhizobium sp. BG8 TaxID=2613773 RepID=UPI00193DCCC5|nr:MarR family transcriptional regulator [Sinorhizobium sp. BG8]QRM57326.1 MarR family transcriptional regulator [Sinorhizobium sp. BG8]
MDTYELPPRFRFGIEFAMLARQWRRSIETQLERNGLTDATWAPLIHLHELGDGISQKDLAARVGIDGSSLVRLLDILAAKNLIERKGDRTDRRAKLIFLTAEGRKEVSHVRKALNAAEAHFLADVSDDEIANMLGILRRIDGRLRATKEHAGREP